VHDAPPGSARGGRPAGSGAAASTRPCRRERERKTPRGRVNARLSAPGYSPLGGKRARDNLGGLLEHLIGKGKNVRVFDPHIRLDEIYGSNRNFVLQQIPHIGRLLDARLEDTLDWADHLVVAQKPTDGMLAQIESTGLPVTSLIGAARPDAGRLLF